MPAAPSPEIAISCRVEGRVQGVFFRASTAREALGLGLTGHALNLPDGSVEVLVCGAPDAVARLRKWLGQGPPMARVDRIVCEPVELPNRPDRFVTG